MRFYLLTVQHNVEKNAENRVVPKAFDTEEEAIASFHSQMGTDMKNATLDWAISMVVNEYGGIVKNERWTREVEEVVEELAQVGTKENPKVFDYVYTNRVEQGLWYSYEKDDVYKVALCIRSGATNDFFDENYFIEME